MAIIPDYQQRIIREAAPRARGDYYQPYTTRAKGGDTSAGSAGALDKPATGAHYWVVGVDPLDDSDYILM